MAFSEGAGDTSNPAGATPTFAPSRAVAGSPFAVFEGRAPPRTLTPCSFVTGRTIPGDKRNHTFITITCDGHHRHSNRPMRQCLLIRTGPRCAPKGTLGAAQKHSALLIFAHWRDSQFGPPEWSQTTPEVPKWEGFGLSPYSGIFYP